MDGTAIGIDKDRAAGAVTSAVNAYSRSTNITTGELLFRERVPEQSYSSTTLVRSETPHPTGDSAGGPSTEAPQPSTEPRPISGMFSAGRTSVRRSTSGRLSVEEIARTCVVRELEQRARYDVLRAGASAVLEAADRSIASSNRRVAAGRVLMNGLASAPKHSRRC
jgi:hypothetical protein